METVKTEWRSSLDQQLEEINDKFSGFFKEMGCAGQVSLNDQGSVSPMLPMFILSVHIE